MTGRVNLIEAGLLNADHIGKIVRFRTHDTDRDIITVVTAELRQVSHNSSETTITYGVGAERQITLDGDDRVIVGPRADYADVEAMAEINTAMRVGR